MRRRDFLSSSLGIVALGSLARAGRVSPNAFSKESKEGVRVIERSRPIARVPLYPDSVKVDGVPFASTFTGDGFPKLNIPFHNAENVFDGGPPEPEEEIDVAVVGGGISGLASAYLLREHNTVLFELHQRCGGAAQGEHWAGTPYSLGNAYVITPDSGTFLDSFYRELGLDKVVRPDLDEEFTFELGQEVFRDFLAGDHPPEERAGFDRYLQILARMADEEYPEIPIPEGSREALVALDQLTLKQHIEQEMGGLPVPQIIQTLIQSYCYSSFAAGWEEISAAGGWNFLAAEVYGRWVFPGGTSYMADAIWQRLTQEDRESGGSERPRVRGGSRVVDVRMWKNDRVLVTYRDSTGVARSVAAKRVVMCCPKHVAKHILHDIEKNDPLKLDAINTLEYRPYVVANVLLQGQFNQDYYDIFLLGDGVYPEYSGEASKNSFVTDMLNGQYARTRKLSRSVLTLYWPLPWAGSRFTLVTEDSWRNYAEALVPQLDSILSLVGLTKNSVRQVRMTRWGDRKSVV